MICKTTARIERARTAMFNMLDRSRAHNDEVKVSQWRESEAGEVSFSVLFRTEMKSNTLKKADAANLVLDQHAQLWKVPLSCSSQATARSEVTPLRKARRVPASFTLQRRQSDQQTHGALQSLCRRPRLSDEVNLAIDDRYAAHLTLMYS